VKRAENWKAEAVTALAEAGFRSGGARRQVLELLGGESCALTALEIDRRLPRVGRASVYRTLELLDELGLVQKVDLGGEAAGYERVEPGGHHHHHMVCERCGRVVTFEDEPLERAIVALERRRDFNVSSHEVTLRGQCASCRP
jgi:Fur family ferric uptake transcriptional regulator